MIGPSIGRGVYCGPPIPPLGSDNVVAALVKAFKEGPFRYVPWSDSTPEEIDLLRTTFPTLYQDLPGDG